MKLYEIAKAMRALLEAMDEYIDEDTGEIAPEFRLALNALEGEAKDKIEGIGVVCRELRGDIATVKEERARLKARKLSMENRIKWLTNYVTDMMNALDLGKHTSPNALFTVYMQKNPDTVHIERPDALPEVFQRITVEPAKKEIKIALEAGDLSEELQKLAGIELITGVKKVRYK